MRAASVDGRIYLTVLMYQLEWIFLLRPNERDGFGGAKELVVHIRRNVERPDWQLYVEITGPDCLRLFELQTYLLFNAFPVLFDVSDCTFLKIDSPNEGERLVYVNSLLVKAAPKGLISFDVNMRLDLKDMAADRDNFRIDLDRTIRRFIALAVLDPAAQDACFEYILNHFGDGERGDLPNDLRFLDGYSRDLIRQSLVRRFACQMMAKEYRNVMPISLNAKDTTIIECNDLLRYVAVPMK